MQPDLKKAEAGFVRRLEKGIALFPELYREQLGTEGSPDILKAAAERFVDIETEQVRWRLQRGAETAEDFKARGVKEPWRMDSLIDVFLLMEESRTNRLVALYSVLRGRGIIQSIEDMKSFEVVMLSPSHLERDDVARMEQIYKRNYRDNPELRDLLIESFRKNNERDSGWLYELKRDNEIIAFDRVDEDKEKAELFGKHVMHFGALNVAPDLRGAYLGEALLDKSVGELLTRGDTILIAECDIDTPVTRAYLNRRGFIGRSYDPDFHGIGKLDIVLYPGAEKMLVTKDIPTERLLSVMEDANFDAPMIRGTRVLLERVKKPSELSFHYLNNERKDGFVLVGIRELDGGEFLGVFEKRTPGSSTPEPDAI